MDSAKAILTKCTPLRKRIMLNKQSNLTPQKLGKEQIKPTVRKKEEDKQKNRDK